MSKAARTVCGILAALSLLLLIGTVGSLSLGDIGAGRGLIQGGIGLAGVGIFGVLAGWFK